MDIYIALVVSAIFILQLWKEVSPEEKYHCGVGSVERHRPGA